MTLEVSCPSCDNSFLLEESAVGAELSCPACMRQLPLDNLQLSSPEAVNAPPHETPHAEPHFEPAPTRSEGSAEEIVCPRCKLHFNPKRHTRDVAAGSRPTVLIVEDMGYFMKIAEDALSGYCEVKKATGIDEAREYLVAGGIDLLVLDLTLGGGDDGINLLEGMAIKPCPILIFTARDESEMYGEEWEDLQKLGADDIVIKGMNAAESLRKKVGALLGRQWDDEEDIG